MGRRRTKVPRGRPDLTPLELEVMVVVWELGDCTSAQVIEAFPGQRRLAPPTIRSVLSKLRAKGYLKAIPSVGRGDLLRPVVRRESVARQSLRELLGSLFESSPRQAIAYLLDQPEMSEKDLEELHQLIEEQKRRRR